MSGGAIVGRVSTPTIQSMPRVLGFSSRWREMAQLPRSDGSLRSIGMGTSAVTVGTNHMKCSGSFDAMIRLYKCCILLRCPTRRNRWRRVRWIPIQRSQSCGNGAVAARPLATAVGLQLRANCAQRPAQGVARAFVPVRRSQITRGGVPCCRTALPRARHAVLLPQRGRTIFVCSRQLLTERTTSFVIIILHGSAWWFNLSPNKTCARKRRVPLTATGY